MRQELEKAYAMFDVDDRVKCVVVTGYGRVFCAGADLDIGFGDGGEEGGEAHRDGWVVTYLLSQVYSTIRYDTIRYMGPRSRLQYGEGNDG
jgi:enoyl-CoA hydratase/carnithine racemase